MNLASYLKEKATEHSDQTALVHGRQRLSFAEFDASASRVAYGLGQQGIKTGDQVVIAIGMSVPLYVLLIALWRRGAHVVFIDPSLKSSHLQNVLGRISPVCMIGGWKGRIWQLSQPSLRKLRYLHFSMTKGRSDPEMADLTSDTPALITFTSGSTGMPKGLVRSHGFLETQLQLLQPLLHMEPGKVTLATLPIFALSNLASGMTTVIPTGPIHKPAGMNGKKIARCIRRERIQSITASPAFYEQLLQDQADRFSGVEHLFIGGAAVFPDLMDRLHTQFPESEVIAVYGSSEAEPIAEMSWDDLTLERRQAIAEGAGLYAGTPVESISLRLVDHEIQVTGPQVLTSYLDGIGDAENKINEGDTIWHRSGDAGRLDSKGGLWLLGRCSARQGDLFPFAVEAAAVALGGIRLAGLVRVNEKNLLAVHVLAGQSVDAPALTALCTQHSIDEWTCIDIPTDRRHNAKVDYPALRRLLERKGKLHGQ